MEGVDRDFISKWQKGHVIFKNTLLFLSLVRRSNNKSLHLKNISKMIQLFRLLACAWSIIWFFVLFFLNPCKEKF